MGIQLGCCEDELFGLGDLSGDVTVLRLRPILDCAIRMAFRRLDNNSLLSSDGLDAQITNTPSLGLSIGLSCPLQTVLSDLTWLVIAVRVVVSMIAMMAGKRRKKERKGVSNNDDVKTDATWDRPPS